MSRYFGRAAQVLVQRKGEAQPIPLLADGDVSGVMPAPGVATASVFTGLHISFKTEKDNLGHPNTLELRIWNLAQSTRDQLKQDGAFVQLLAGYESDLPNLPVVFKGYARSIDHTRTGPDWVTLIQSGDGETAYRYGFSGASFPAGALSKDIAIYLAQQVKAVDPANIDISGFVAKAPSFSYPKASWASGYATQGNAFAELQKILGGKYELSIQNGELRATLATEGWLPGVRLLSPQTGLLGSPEHGTPNLNGLPSILKVACLLDARIQPGDLVQVRSSGVSGTFRVQRAVNVGEIAGNDWKTELECMPLTGAGVASA